MEVKSAFWAPRSQPRPDSCQDHYWRPSAVLSEFRSSRCTLRPTLLMLLEQSIEEFLPPAEIRIPEACERLGHVDHAAIGSEIENSERSGDFESFVARHCRATAVIDENEIGRDRQPKRDRRLLALVQRLQRGVVCRGD
jgi:hypothetical protein